MGLTKAKRTFRYSNNPKVHLCDCGNPAIKHTPSGYVCARCAAIEVHLYNKAECPTAKFAEGRRSAILKYQAP